MSLPYIASSGDSAVETADNEWTDVLEIPGTAVVNWITLINEGDWSGYWRLTDGDGATTATRLVAGAGEPGGRRSVINIPCPGLSGARLQVKKALMGDHLTGIYAFGMK
jgi:hypothetical protein